MMESSRWNFTFEKLKRELQLVQGQGFEFHKLAEQFAVASSKPAFLRVDVDIQPEKCLPLLDVLNGVDIMASFFFRMHSRSYNLLSTGCLEIVDRVRTAGHEIGLHSENVEVAGFLALDSAATLQNALETWKIWFQRSPTGVSSHGGGSNLNNLHFWTERSPQEFGLTYEAYGENGPFSSFRYVSDSNWTEWKAYENRKLLQGDSRSPGEHSADTGLRGLYILIHPETYSWRHPYELSY